MSRTNSVATVAFKSRVRDQHAGTPQGAGHTRTPVHNVHSDYSETGAHEVIQDIIESKYEMEGADAEKFKILAQNKDNRVVLINVWRPLKTVYKDPFATSDWRTVMPDQEAHCYRPRGQTPGRYPCMQWTPTTDHVWYYKSKQTPSEPIVFVQYSRTTRSTSMDV